MHKKFIWIGLLIVSVCACNNKSVYERNSHGITTTVDSTIVNIAFYSPSIVRVTKYLREKGFEKSSLSVIKDAEKVNFDVEENENTITLSTDALKVVLDTKSNTVSYQQPNGDKLLSEKSGKANFIPFNDNGNETYSVTQEFRLDPDEPIYGLGILQRGKMSQRNQKIKMIQGNTEDYIPFFQSVKGYGLFWDNYSPTTFTDDSVSTRFSSEVADGIDYYFMVGDNADGVVAEMRDLTGQVPMFPLWTYGFWQSRERYKSQKEILGVVEKYRDLGVPLDGIIQDWQYWGDNYHWNAMKFLNKEFPEPKQMIDQIHEMNANIIISIWASFGPQTEQFKILNEKGMLMDFQTWPQSGKEGWPPDMDYPSGVKVYDPYNPEARDIYWKYLNDGLFSLGIDGWWMDSTEPDHMDFKDEDLNNETYLGSFRKVRNAFPLMTVGGVYNHQREVTSDKRVFILTRSAFAGQQRYGSNTWSGDVTSTWKNLRNQIPAGLNFSLCGIPYWNSDIGGFFAGSYNSEGQYGTASRNPLFQELYVRWTQFAALTPMMRSHGTDTPREIYQFGSKGEPIYDAIGKAISLRYSLLPYMYSNAWQITNNQSSMMRALVMDFPNDKKVWNMNNEYMFGKAILVAPIVEAQYTPEEAVKAGTDEDSRNKSGNKNDQSSNSSIDFTRKKTTNIYLPTGTTWYDYWTNTKHDGGQEITRESTIDLIPLYIKAGSVLPIGPQVQYAEEKDWSELEIRIYPGANGEFELYEDENDNYNYEEGAYSLINFQWDDTANELTIKDRKGQFEGMLSSRKFKIVKIQEGSTEPKEQIVEYDGDEVTVKL